MSTRREGARMAAEAAAILTAAGLAAAGETSLLRALPLLADGQLVVVANPPTVTYPTWNEVDAEWQLWLVAGPADPAQTDTAWDALDAARDLLVGPLEVDRAEPTAVSDAQGRTWPALVLTTTTHHDTP